MKTNERVASRSDIIQRLSALAAAFTESEIPFRSELEVQKVISEMLSDSLQAMQWVVAIESEFDIEFDDEEISVEFFGELSHIVRLVERSLCPGTG